MPDNGVQPIQEYPPPTPAEDEAQHQWQAAGDRILLYLRCLDFSAPRALELALRALKDAEQNLARGSGENPVAASMQALHHILDEMQGPGASAARKQPPTQPSPPWRRGSMISAGFITR